MTFGNQDQETTRRYLLGRATDYEQQKIEERLLTDDDFFDEFEITKDEVVEDYLAKRLTQQERDWFEQNFLASPEGKQRQAFARTLNHYVSNRRRQKKSGWGERIRAFQNSQPAFLRVAAAIAVVVIVAGIFWISRAPSPDSFATLTLSNTAATRSSGTEVPRIKLNQNALRVKLMLAAPAAPGTRYRAHLLSGTGETNTPEVDGQDPQSVSVMIPGAQLTPGHYAVTLSTINLDGTIQRISGNYQFVVE